MMSVSACLLFPIRPRRNTISGTRVRSSHTLYACGHTISEARAVRREMYLLEIVVVARAQEVDEPRRCELGVQFYLDVSEGRRHVRLPVHQGIEVQEEEVRPALQLLHDPSDLQREVRRLD